MFKNFCYITDKILIMRKYLVGKDEEIDDSWTEMSWEKGPHETEEDYNDRLEDLENHSDRL